MTTAIPSYPYNGSAWVVWDTGTGNTQDPPITNTSPQESDNPPNHDPHEDPRDTPEARTQISEFLKVGGKVVDVCGGDPCHTYNYAP